MVICYFKYSCLSFKFQHLYSKRKRDSRQFFFRHCNNIICSFINLNSSFFVVFWRRARNFPNPEDELGKTMKSEQLTKTTIKQKQLKWIIWNHRISTDLRIIILDCNLLLCINILRQDRRGDSDVRNSSGYVKWLQLTYIHYMSANIKVMQNQKCHIHNRICTHCINFDCTEQKL